MNKMKLRTKLLYGLSGVGDSALYNLMGTFALFFLTTVAGIDPAVAGAITAVGAVWETICGAVIGYVSDNTRSRYGKRKPYLMAASIPLMVFTGMFFVDIDVSQNLMIAYYGLMLVLFWTAFSTFFVPYLAWGAELTHDYHERTVLRGYVHVFNTAGTFIGLVLPNIMVDFFTKNGYSIEISWQIVGIACGIVSGGTILAGALGIRDDYELSYVKGADAEKKARAGIGKSLKKKADAAADMIRSYWEILKLKTVRYIIGASVFYLIGYAIFCSDRMYFFTYNMELSPGVITVVMMILTFASVLFVPVVSWLGKQTDKRSTYMICMLVCIAGMTAYGLMGISSVAGVCIFSVLYCAGNTAYWQLMPAMIYDVCEVDQLVNDKERAGLVISLQSLSESLANAAGLQIMGLILGFSGFDGDKAVQTPLALQWTDLSFSIIPAAAMMISVICIFRYPVTKDMYDKVIEGLAQRAKGRPVDMESFRKLK